MKNRKKIIEWKASLWFHWRAKLKDVFLLWIFTNFRVALVKKETADCHGLLEWLASLKLVWIRLIEAFRHGLSMYCVVRDAEIRVSYLVYFPERHKQAKLGEVFLTNSTLETSFLMGPKKLRTVFHSGNTRRRAYRLFHKLHTCRLKLLPGHSPSIRLPSTMKSLVSSKIASSNSWNLEWKKWWFMSKGSPGELNKLRKDRKLSLSRHCLGFQSRCFSLHVGYNI